MRLLPSGLLLVATLGVLSCARRETPAEAATRAHTLLIGNQSEPADLDPHIVTAYTDQNILMALFEGLTCLDEETSVPVPGIAEKWDISGDGLSYTFHLRANARWSNGERVTAGDFAYSFRRILSPALASEYSYMLWPIKNAEAFNSGKLTDFDKVGVTAIDDTRLRIELERPTPYLLSLAAHPTWFPVQRATIEKFGRIDQRSTAWTRPGNLIGNGAFVLTEWSPNARVVVEKNPHYWGAAKNEIERVVFLPIENPDVEERGFRAGQMQITYTLPTEKIARYRESAPDQLRVDPFLQTFFLRFNVTKPPLDDARIRRALALALDRESLTRNVLRGSRLPADSLVPPGTGGYKFDIARTAAQSQADEARQLLRDAGVAEGKGLPVFELQVRNDDTQPKVAEAIQGMWQRELGVRVTIVPFEQKTWLQNQQSMAYTIAFSGWAGDYADPSTFLELFLRGGGNNWTGWGDAAYDQAIADAAKSTDTAERFTLFQKAESRLLEAAPIAPLYFGARTYLIRPVVKNWRPALLGFHRYQLIKLSE